MLKTLPVLIRRLGIILTDFVRLILIIGLLSVNSERILKNPLYKDMSIMILYAVSSLIGTNRRVLMPYKHYNSKVYNMSKRWSPNQASSRREFTRTAMNTHARNVTPPPMRGGYRI